MANRTYDHSQLGYIVLISLSVTLMVFSLQFVLGLGSPKTGLLGYLFFSGLTLFIASLFYKLRVVVDTTGIHLIYGIGLIKFHIKPDHVKSVRIVRNPWYYGLGIRIIPKGMLYNIHGLDAVEIIYEDGREKMVRIGSDEVHVLKAYLENKYALDNITE